MGDVEVKGLRELIRATDDIQNRFLPVMTDAATDVARMVVTAARSAARSPQQRLAASTLNAGADGAAGTVSSNAPFFAGAEFGGGNRPNTRQFPPHRGKRGYFLYPSMRANAAALNRRWDEGVEEAMAAWDYKPRGT